jgi:hypothetical protein
MNEITQDTSLIEQAYVILATGHYLLLRESVR